MAKITDSKVAIDLTVHYNDAAQKMLQRRGIFAGKPESPKDVQEALCRGLKNKQVVPIGENEVVHDGEMPIFVFHPEGEITAFGSGGRRSFLFKGDSGAGFVEYGLYGRPIYMYYSDAKGSVEMIDGDKYIRTIEGKKEEFKLKPEDYTQVEATLGGEPDPDWVNACNVMLARVDEMERDAQMASSWAGMRK